MQQCLSLLHHMVSHQEHPWNLLPKIFQQRRRKILKKWPHSSSITLSSHMSVVHLNLLHHEEQHSSHYIEATMKIVVFDKYPDISAKDHDRIPQASGVVLHYDLFTASHLP